MNKTGDEFQKVSAIVVLAIGIPFVVHGWVIANSELPTVTYNTSGNWATDDGVYKAAIIYNFTGKGGFFALEPIDVSVTVIHESRRMENFTGLIFPSSNYYPVNFSEISRLGVYVPEGGKVKLNLVKTYGPAGLGIYKGWGKIVYGIEGEYSSSLVPTNVTGLARYSSRLFKFTEPAIRIGPRSELQQLRNNEITLGLTWIVTGLTIMTTQPIVVTVGKLIHSRIHYKRKGQIPQETKHTPDRVGQQRREQTLDRHGQSGERPRHR